MLDVADVIEPIHAPFPMGPLSRPQFPDRTYSITDYGARTGGTVKNTAAIAAAIAACHRDGGGHVLIPQGVWLTGAVHLKSNVDLHLAQGATLRFSDDPADYLPVVFVRWSGVECYNYSPLIYAHRCQNVAITGQGSLDGNGKKWWNWQLPLSDRELKSNLRNLHCEAQGIPVEARRYGTEEAGMRPQFVVPIDCRNVLIEGISLNSGPFWTFDITYCENVIVRRIRVENHGPNNDGVNIDSSSNVLIEHSEFQTGDDSICMKAGMNEDGLRVNRPTQNVVVRHCRTGRGHGGIVIGSDTSGGIRNLYVHDCAFDGTNIGIRFKTVKGRGGVVENLWFENIQMGLVKTDAIQMSMFYPTRTIPKVSRALPVFQDLCFRNITCRQAQGFGLNLDGLEDSPIRKLRFENIHIQSQKGVRQNHCEDLSFKNVLVEAACSQNAASGGQV